MKIFRSILSVLIFLSFSIPVLAANPAFGIRPGSGRVKSKTSFIVDILIDSKGKEISFARAALKFDPTIVQVEKAQRNASLFCSYPEDEQSIDNEQGLLMISGFCQSGSGAPYKTSGEADVFARVTFSVLKTGNISLRWQYSGEDVHFMSVIMKDGSPPQNILTDSPRNASFTSVKSLSTPTPPTPGTVPSTGFSVSIGLIGAGILLIILGFIYVKWSDNSYKSKLKTVVVYGDKK